MNFTTDKPGSLAGQTCVVTGASDGIGRATAQAFATAGASVVLVGRNEAKTAAAARAIMSITGSRTVTWEIADLARQDSVNELVERLRTRHPTIHVLVNNAGALFLEREVTVDGIERTFALNHLAYFSLTLQLLGNLAAAAINGAPARIICVASRAHRDARLRANDWQLARGFSGWKAYANSKLANILFVRALAARLDPTQVIVHAMHPGLVRTRFAVNNGRLGRLIRRIMDLRSISVERGADTVSWLATVQAATLGTGGYWVKRSAVSPSSLGENLELAETLWHDSAQLLSVDAEKMVTASNAQRRELSAQPSIVASATR